MSLTSKNIDNNSWFTKENVDFDNHTKGLSLILFLSLIIAIIGFIYSHIYPTPAKTVKEQLPSFVVVKIDTIPTGFVYILKQKDNSVITITSNVDRLHVGDSIKCFKVFYEIKK
jgi:hypothetical protein